MVCVRPAAAGVVMSGKQWRATMPLDSPISLPPHPSTSLMPDFLSFLLRFGPAILGLAIFGVLAVIVDNPYLVGLALAPALTMELMLHR